jgi:hypothetical protein
MSSTPVSPFAPADNPAAIAHIALLQGVINRLAANSASCKTWCLALVSALLSLAAATKTVELFSFALVPVVIFALLDAAYLAQERAYRGLYGNVVASMRDGSYGRHSVFAAGAAFGGRHFLKAFGSWSIWPIYGGLVALYLAAWRSGWLAALEERMS